jgi:hypothetical protein
MSTFFYKYVVANSFTKGRKTALYLSRFIFRLYRSLPILLRLAIVSFRFFTLLYKSCNSLINFRFWLLAIHQFLQIYQIIFILRILTEYYFVNQHSSNKFIKIIFYLSEPYFKLVQLFTPKGIIGTMIGFQAIEVVSYFMRNLCRILSTYSTKSLCKNLTVDSNGLLDLNELSLLLKLVSDEKLLFIN